MHQSGLKALKDFLNCSMSLAFTFLCSINQTKTMTLEGTLDFHKKLDRYEGTKTKKLNKVIFIFIFFY